MPKKRGGCVSVFYVEGALEQLYLDRFKYRGRGRPRKADYSTLAELQKSINTLRNKQIDAQLFTSSLQLFI